MENGIDSKKGTSFVLNLILNPIYLFIIAPIVLVMSIIISIQESSIEPLLYGGILSVSVFFFALWQRKRHKKNNPKI